MRRPTLILCALFLAFAGLAPAAPPGGKCESPTCSCAECDAKCRCCFRADAEAFNPGGPVSPDGVRSTVDIPASQHMRNTGGIGPRGPGSGAGLCVFTSVEVMARWMNVPALYGLQKYMTTREGGGWPDKLTKVLAAFAGDKIAYVQHTGGDETFLERALATRRIVAVTYAGRDDFYRESIAHMVNLVHLDGQRAAIVDNNRPGVWVWMTRAEFLQRWRAMGGGWAVVLLGPPPPPHKAAGWQFVVGQCPGGRCPLPAASPFTPFVPPAPVDPEPAFEWDEPRHDEAGPYWLLRRGGAVVGAWYGGGYHRVGSAPGRYLEAVSPCPATPPAEKPAAVPIGNNFGVDPTKIHNGRRWYSVSGREVDRGEALSAFGDDLPADGDRFYLTAVGDPAFLARAKDEVARLNAADRGRLHVQFYAPEHWAVVHFGLPNGVSVRKPAGPNGEATEVGVIAPTAFTPDELLALIDLALRLKPKPVPVPPLAPTPVPNPAPTPTPGPTPTPDGPACSLRKFAPWLVVAALFLRNLFRSAPAPVKE